eukprot:8267877-Pyramimonas_sp.AAC.1
MESITLDHWSSISLCRCSVKEHRGISDTVSSSAALQHGVTQPLASLKKSMSALEYNSTLVQIKGMT